MFSVFLRRKPDYFNNLLYKLVFCIFGLIILTILEAYLEITSIIATAIIIKYN